MPLLTKRIMSAIVVFNATTLIPSRADIWFNILNHCLIFLGLFQIQKTGVIGIE